MRSRLANHVPQWLVRRCSLALSIVPLQRIGLAQRHQRRIAAPTRRRRRENCLETSGTSATGRFAAARKRRYHSGAMVDGRDERESDEDDGPSRSVPRGLAEARAWKKWLRIPIALFMLVGAFASVWSLSQEVRAGRGGELRRSMWGFKVSPIGILVAVGSSVVALFGIWAVEWWLHRRDRTWTPRHPRKPT